MDTVDFGQGDVVSNGIISGSGRRELDSLPVLGGLSPNRTVSRQLRAPQLNLGKDIKPIMGGRGRDRILVGKSEVVYAKKGQDILDARDGKGGNILFGEKGRDRLFANKNDELFGNQDNDFLSSRDGKGRNILRGGQGNDDLIAGKRDRLYGRVGADVLDASAGRGKNQLFAGRGDDVLYGGVDDVLMAGQGQDTLLAGNGGNTLTGGQGHDQFWLVDGELPTGVNTVTDFDLNQDKVVIGRVDGVNSLSDVTLTQNGDDTIVTIQGQDIAVLNGVDATQLTEDHFIFATSFVNGVAGQTVDLEVTLESRAAKFDNEMGYFLVDDAQGRIGDLLPEDEGYTQAALERAKVVFRPKQKAGTVKTLEVPAQSYVGWYLVQDGTANQVLRRNPDNTVQNRKVKNDEPLVFFSSPEANPDGDRHVAYRSSDELAWEDLTNGGDRSFDDLVFSIEPQETVVEGIQIMEPEGATTQGFKWNDLNGDGVRNVLIQGTPPEIIFVIDVSPSALDPFQGSLTGDGDINGDGRSNTRLDAELAGFIALNQQLMSQGLDDAKVGIVTFGRSAIQVDMIPLTDDLDLVLSPTTDADNNGTSDVEDVLKSITRTISGTNFEAGLRAAQDTFAEVGTAPGNGNIIFLSDGDHNSFTAYGDEAAELADAGIKLSAFGVGTDANLNSLRVINPEAQRFTTTDELISFFGGVTGRSGLQEPGLAGVTVYLDLNNNAQLDAGEPSQVTSEDDPATPDIDETGFYSFTDLEPGTYTVREVISAGFRQTSPSGDPLADNDGFADRVLEFFDGGEGPIAGAYGSNGGIPTGNEPLIIEPVSPEVALGAPPEGAIDLSNPDITWLSLPTGSYVTLGFDERVVDGPGDDIFIQGVGSDAAVAVISVSTNGVDFEPLEIAEESSLTRLDLGDIDFDGSVTALRIGGLDLAGRSPGFDLVSVSVSATSIDYSGAHTVTVVEAQAVDDLNFGNTRRS